MCIPQEEGERNGYKRILAGQLKFFEGKRGDGRKFWKQEVGMTIFSDAIERLRICSIFDKPLHKWSSLFL